MDEIKCECGASIPLGYGYYNYGKAVRCFFCGRINMKSFTKEQLEELKKIKK